MDTPRSKELTERLRRLEGQVQGIQRMVLERRACLDILTQLAAVRGAVQEAELLLLRGHLEACLAEALRSGRPEAWGRSIDEILAALGRLRR